MKWVLIVWLHSQGFPVTVEPYETLETCQMALNKGKAQVGFGWWMCLPKDHPHAP
jgi:hypothetical protein